MPERGDGAEVVDDLLVAHADAVVLDGEGAGGGVRDQRHRQLVGAQQRRVGDRLEAQLLAGVRGVGDQLPQEDFLVRVQRMDDQSQNLLGFGLEFFDLVAAVSVVMALNSGDVGIR